MGNLNDKTLKIINEIFGAIYLMSHHPEALKEGVKYPDLVKLGVLSGAEFLLERGYAEKFRTNDIISYKLTQKGERYLKGFLKNFPSE